MNTPRIPHIEKVGDWKHCNYSSIVPFLKTTQHLIDCMNHLVFYSSLFINHLSGFQFFVIGINFVNTKDILLQVKLWLQRFVKSPPPLPFHSTPSRFPTHLLLSPTQASKMPPVWESQPLFTVLLSSLFVAITKNGDKLHVDFLDILMLWFSSCHHFNSPFG